MRKHHSPGAQRTGRGGDAGRAGLLAPDLARGTHVLRRHSPGAQRTGRKRDLQGERYAAPSKSQGPELRCALRYSRRRGQRCAAPSDNAGAALVRKRRPPGAQRTGRGGDAGRASCCAPVIAGAALMRKHHSPGAQRTGRKRICRASGLLRPLNRKGQSCASPSDIAGAGGQRTVRGEGAGQELLRPRWRDAEANRPMTKAQRGSDSLVGDNLPKWS